MSDPIEQIRQREQAATPGPWGWRGHDTGSVELRTLHSGGLRIISTARQQPCTVWVEAAGYFLMDEACAPCRGAYANREVDSGRCEKPENLDTVWVWDPSGFIKPINEWTEREQPYRSDVARTTHPDAEFIAHAREDVAVLLAEIDRLTALLGDRTERAA